MTSDISRLFDTFATGSMPEFGNAVAILLCVAFYGLFISRDRDDGAARSVYRHGGPRRSPDSILRGGGR